MEYGRSKMTGEHRVIVETEKVKYDFKVTRNITIIKGDSATGKTTLIELIKLSDDISLDISITCDKECVVLEGKKWQKDLSDIKDSIVFIDEGNKFVNTAEFAKAIKNSDNYYVIATREALKQLPYSINEVYGLREKSKYRSTHKKYNETYNIYTGKYSGNKINPDLIVTEDSNSGNDFFNHICKETNIGCTSANGKSNVFKVIEMTDTSSYNCMLVVVDGAAFGPDFEEVYRARYIYNKVVVYAPESFEWLLLKSGIIKNLPKDKLENPCDYVESSKYFSWEQYFTDLIVEATRDTPFRYSKHRLNKAYLSDTSIRRIIKSMGFLKILEKEKQEEKI